MVTPFIYNTGVKCPPIIGDGAMIVSDHKEQDVDFNDTLITVCSHALYRFNGDRERRCQQNGELTGEPLRCYAECELLLDQTT